MQHKTNTEKPKDNIALQALSMAFGTMTSRVLGLIRDQAFAAMFDRTITDAWTVAFRLPNMFRRLLGEGSLSVSFIPIFVEAKTLDPSGVRARNLVNAFYCTLLILLSTLTALGVFFAPQIVGLLTDQVYAFVPGKLELTIRMAKVMFCFIFFMSSYAFFMGILNSFGKFGLAAAAPTLFNVAMIIANFIPKHWQLVEGDALALGVVVGGFLQTAILIPALHKLGYFPRLKWDFRNQDANQVWRKMLPGMLGMGLLQITTVINTQFASRLGEGPLTYLYLADRLLELPLSLISVSLGTALLPTLAKHWAKGDRQTMVQTANYYFRLNLFTAMPAAVGLYLLSQPIVELLFMRNKFSALDATATARIVQLYGFTLLASSSVRVLVPSFYAIKNTWLPAGVSMVCLIVHVILAPLLMSRWQVDGLVISTMLSAFLNLTMLVMAHRWLIGPFGIRSIGFSLLKMLVPTLAVAGISLLYGMIYRFLGEGVGGRILSLSAVIFFAGISYAALSQVLKIQEYQDTAGRVFGRLAAKFKPRS